MIRYWHARSANNASSDIVFTKYQIWTTFDFELEYQNWTDVLPAIVDDVSMRCQTDSRSDGFDLLAALFLKHDRRFLSCCML